MVIKESETVELKKSLSQLEKALKTACAFANHKGGAIYFGIDEQTNSVVGQVATDSNIKNISQQIRQRISPQIIPSIEVIKIEKKPVIKVTISKFGNDIHYFDGKPYKRSGTETVVMSPNEIKKLIIDASKFEWDSQICEEAKLDDLDKKKISNYLKLRQESRKTDAKINIPQLTFLKNIKAIEDRKPTNAGVLFFAKNPLIHIPHAQIRCARIKGTENFNDILDRLDCSGTIWEMILQSEEFIKKNIRYSGIRSEKFQRTDKYEYPIKALREALINAVIHRDYLNKADVRVFIFDDRIEIINPGSFPEGVTPDKPLHKPVCAILSNYMYDIGFIEKYGSGINLEKSLCKENGNEQPKYELQELETKVIFKTSIKTISINIDELNSKFELNDRQKKAIEFIANNAKITNTQYQDLTKSTKKTATRDLNDLIDKKLINKKGTTGKGTHYIIGDIKGTSKET
jgi:ATP-dependent DNA helicase RecG